MVTIHCTDCGTSFPESEYEDHPCTPKQTMSERERRDKLDYPDMH